MIKDYGRERRRKWRTATLKAVNIVVVATEARAVLRSRQKARRVASLTILPEATNDHQKGQSSLSLRRKCIWEIH